MLTFSKNLVTQCVAVTTSHLTLEQYHTGESELWILSSVPDTIHLSKALCGIFRDVQHFLKKIRIL